MLPGRSIDDPYCFTVKMTDLWFMHLRHTAVPRLAEAGCEVPLISAVTGYSPKSVDQILSRYLLAICGVAVAFGGQAPLKGEGALRAGADQVPIRPGGFLATARRLGGLPHAGARRGEPAVTHSSSRTDRENVKHLMFDVIFRRFPLMFQFCAN